MNLKYKLFVCLFVAFALSGISPANASSGADSLAVYLEAAAQNNVGLKASFYEYQAALQRVPQAGAFSDPELSFSFFVQPMDQLMGRQIGSVELMQMFPWFGTRKAARSEAQEMARMKFETFRDKKATLEEQVKVQWYALLKQQEQQQYLEDQLKLLRQIEALSLRKVSSPAVARKGSTSVVTQNATMNGTVASVAAAGMSGMGGMATAQVTAPATGTMSDMKENMSGSGMEGSGSSLSDVLRIQLEITDMENELETTVSSMTAAKATLNALLSRDRNNVVILADTLVKVNPSWNNSDFNELLIANNPMLAMLKAEEKAMRYKADMDHKMSLPMFGVGLEYMINAKTSASGMDGMKGLDNTSGEMNGKDMIMPMVKVSVPIFRKKYKAQAKENSYYQQMSRLKYEDTFNMLYGSYTALKQQMEDADRKIKLYDKQIALAQATLKLVVSDFTTAQAGLTDIIQVERQLRELNFKKIEAVGEYNLRASAIEKMITNNFNTIEE